MPKVGKIKYKKNGEYMTNTRTSEQYAIDIDLYYHVDNDNFYFKTVDIKEKTGVEIKDNAWGYPGIFKDCYTKKDACDKMSKLINSSGVEKKHLLLKIKTNNNHILEVGSENGIKNLLKKVIAKAYTSNESEILSITVTRVVSIINKVGKVYYKPYKDWDYSKYDSMQTVMPGLIDWTQEREDFLVSMSDQLATLSRNIIKFFNVESDEELTALMTPKNKFLKINN